MIPSSGRTDVESFHLFDLNTVDSDELIAGGIVCSRLNVAHLREQLHLSDA